ncbi:alpha/beta hydrolase [Chloroflexota bacterium]
MSETHINIPCDDIILEGTLSYPVADGQFAGVVVCHPHPLYGGDMHNSVVDAVYQELENRSVIALRFNFRGVGNSGGLVADSAGNLNDVGAAIDYLLTVESVDTERIGLVGYSYGGSIVLCYAPNDERIRAIATISPAMTPISSDSIIKYDKPKYFISGEKDGVVPVDKFKYLVEKVAEPKGFRIAAGVDHFWAGHEDVMADDVVSFLVKTLTAY